MTDRISIDPLPAGKTLSVTIRPPGSKSITNRALICAALAKGTSTLTGVLDSEDTQVMIESLRRLGVAIEGSAASTTLRVTGSGGEFSANKADLYIANSGTSVRFLTAAVAAAGRGEFRLSGTERMHERPIGDLLTGLAQLGVTVRSEQREGFPPVVVEARGLQGGQVQVRGDVSSQFLSGLMMAAPLAVETVELAVVGELVSVPYVAMTARVMRSFGVDVRRQVSWETLRIDPQRYQATDYDIEPDASAASYFLAAAALCGGTATVEGLSRESLQGDVRFAEVLGKMGCAVRYEANSITVSREPITPLIAIDVDMNDISDTVQSLAPVALFAQGTTRVRGVAHNRHKETDRIGDLARELRKLGAVVEEFDDGLAITPPTRLSGAEIATYKDHRMAMSMALVGLRVPGVTILDPRCTEKTYPTYFDDLKKLY